MDLVVNRLSEIEAAAVRILDESAIRNKELDEASEKALKEFDAKIDAETAKKMETLRQKLDIQMKEKLAGLQAETEKVMASIAADYDANHEQLAEHILQKLIKE